MQSGRLFEGAPEALSINAHWLHGQGWVLIFRLRREGEQWRDVRSEAYSHLSTGELVDVLEAEVNRMFSS